MLLNGDFVAVDHGGSLDRARKLFPAAPEPWVDLSTGINPHSYPLFDLPATAFTRLPEPSRHRELCAIAAGAYGAPGAQNVAAAPGTQVLLPRAAALVKPSRARILGPTYAEHARAAAFAGHEVQEVSDFGDLEGADLAVVVNPNNPDGRIVPRRDLLDLARAMRGRGGLLVVDEAFMDVGPAAESLCGDAAEEGLLVLRSFGKFFGLAGVRLGFAIGAEPVVRRLDAELGPWCVPGPALEYGCRALADREWQDAMRARLAQDVGRLDALLDSVGVRVTGGTILYRHIWMAEAASLFASLGQEGIIMRRFAERPEVLRSGLPADEIGWTRLESALRRWASGNSRGAES